MDHSRVCMAISRPLRSTMDPRSEMAGVGTGVQIRGTNDNRTEINGVGTVGSGTGRGGINFEDVNAAIQGTNKVIVGGDTAQDAHHRATAAMGKVERSPDQVQIHGTGSHPIFLETIWHRTELNSCHEEHEEQKENNIF